MTTQVVERPEVNEQAEAENIAKYQEVLNDGGERAAEVVVASAPVEPPKEIVFKLPAKDLDYDQSGVRVVYQDALALIKAVNRYNHAAGLAEVKSALADAGIADLRRAVCKKFTAENGDTYHTARADMRAEKLVVIGPKGVEIVAAK